MLVEDPLAGSDEASPALTTEIWPGRPYPLGATYDGVGTNFSVFSEAAERVELCLFDDLGREERVLLPEVTGFCFHGYVPHVRPGQRYGFRVHGPWNPKAGHRCLASKLLIDPYARAIEGRVEWDEAVFPYKWGTDGDEPNDLDSADYVPKSVVTNPFFDWGRSSAPGTPLHETVIYETHVRGFTMTHPDIPEEQRGTYAGLAHPAAIDHLKRLGVTAVELMPVHQFVHDSHLVEKRLHNYWGYNSIGFFAPHDEYANDPHSGAQVQEFKQMVKILHEEGIEVILDVVYNHTAEGNHLGPVLSMKGLDNRAYYRLMPDDPRYYMDYTGTGNSMNMQHPHVLQLIMDSLRYWVQEMHVDGFRFDLASTLARELHDVDRLSAFFDIIQQDPVISQVKLIAEPWDVGDGGYQVGKFPPLWSEWNDRFRGCVRDFWRDGPQPLAEFAYRFTGSSDLYESTGRRPYASVNFVTAHDGFTLEDLVSYNGKHNEANGEDSRDGSDDNRSWNHGIEGPTDDPAIRQLRDRQKRNLLVTLLLSQGIPMILGGDEIGRTQRGNNNAYCQDNEVSWYDWENVDEGLLDFTSRLIAFRRSHSVFARSNWFKGRAIHGEDVNDIAWFGPGGQRMSEHEWGQAPQQALGIFMYGRGIARRGPRGEPILDDSFYLLINAEHEPVEFTVPEEIRPGDWRRVLDTATGEFDEEAGDSVDAGAAVTLEALSLMVFSRREGDA